MGIREVPPACNLETLRDGRGGIFTFFPVDAPIVEWNLIFTRAGESRGFHYHPEFDEYILVASGHGAYVGKRDDGADSFRKVAAGTCLHFAANTPHTLHAITDMRVVAMLTKRWDDCERPIVRVT